MLERQQRPAIDPGGRAGVVESGLRCPVDRDVAGDADHPRRVREDESHPVEERVAAEERVSVDAADVAVAREVESAVQRVGLAAVLLVDHEETRVRPAAIDAADRLRRKRPPVEPLDRLELEGGAQRREGLVGGAVVDDHDLVLGIVDLKK